MGHRKRGRYESWSPSFFIKEFIRINCSMWIYLFRIYFWENIFIVDVDYLKIFELEQSTLNIYWNILSQSVEATPKTNHMLTYIWLDAVMNIPFALLPSFTYIYYKFYLPLSMGMSLVQNQWECIMWYTWYPHRGLNEPILLLFLCYFKCIA